jgi:hypothetical protein
MSSFVCSGGRAARERRDLACFVKEVFFEVYLPRAAGCAPRTYEAGIIPSFIVWKWHMGGAGV